MNHHLTSFPVCTDYTIFIFTATSERKMPLCQRFVFCFYVFASFFLEDFVTLTEHFLKSAYNSVHIVPSAIVFCDSTGIHSELQFFPKQSENFFFWVGVMATFWARVVCSLALKNACFRMRITLGVVLIRSLVCAICAPGRLRSGFGVALN